MLLELCLAALFSAWLLLTFLKQISKRCEIFISRYDWLRLIPSWSSPFLHQPPGEDDYILMMRTKPKGSKSFSNWDVVLQSTQQPLWSCVFNPVGIQNKCLSDLAQSLSAAERQLMHEGLSRVLIQLTPPYLTILCFIKNNITSAKIESYQFSLSSHTRRSDELLLRFLSHQHKLDL